MDDLFERVSEKLTEEEIGILRNAIFNYIQRYNYSNVSTPVYQLYEKLIKAIDVTISKYDMTKLKPIAKEGKDDQDQL